MTHERSPQGKRASRVLALQEVFVALQRADGDHESQDESQAMGLAGLAFSDQGVLRLLAGRILAGIACFRSPSIGVNIDPAGPTNKAGHGPRRQGRGVCARRLKRLRSRSVRAVQSGRSVHAA